MRINTKLNLNSLLVLTLFVLNAIVATFLLNRMVEHMRFHLELPVDNGWELGEASEAL